MCGNLDWHLSNLAFGRHFAMRRADTITFQSVSWRCSPPLHFNWCTSGTFVVTSSKMMGLICYGVAPWGQTYAFSSAAMNPPPIMLSLTRVVNPTYFKRCIAHSVPLARQTWVIGLVLAHHTWESNLDSRSRLSTRDGGEGPLPRGSWESLLRW